MTFKKGKELENTEEDFLGESLWDEDESFDDNYEEE